MKIAVPIVKNQLSMHFGRCELFAIYLINEKEKKLISKTLRIPPPHHPAIFPPWIKSLGCQLVITGGMGLKAQRLFKKMGIQVIISALRADPDEVVLSYLNNALQLGENACQH